MHQSVRECEEIMKESLHAHGGGFRSMHNNTIIPEEADDELSDHL